MRAPDKIWGLVLAGGKSTRMGSDKALLKRGGETQLSRAVSLLESHVDRVFVSARADQAGDPERSKFEQIVDQYEELGPVAGILSALDAHRDVSWLVLACDLPNIDGATIAYLIENASPDDPVTAFESVVDGLPEPLCAIYRPESRALIKAFVEKGMICPRKMLVNSDTHLLTQPSPGALHNINAPEDLAGTGIESAS